MIKGSEVTVRDILKLELLENAKVLAGEAGLGHEVNYTEVMIDTDVLQFLKRGELLMALVSNFTGLTEEMLDHVIDGFAERDLAGLLIKAREGETIPQKLVDLANQKGLPLIQIDFEISLSDIMSLIFKVINDRQQAILERVETLHKDIMGVALKGGGVNDILVSLSRTIKNPIFVKDYQFENVFFDSALFTKDYKLLQNFVDSGYYRDINVAEAKMMVDTVNVAGEEITRLVLPIVLKNAVYGHIITFGLSDKLSSYDRLGIENASNLIALEFLKEISVHDVENKYKLEFFDDLISLDDARRNTALNRASSYKFIEDAFFGVVCINLGEESIHDQDNDVINQLIMRCTYLVEIICRDRNRPYLIASKGNKIFVTIMFKDPEKAAKRLEQYANTFNEVIESKVKKIDLYYGVGRVYQGLVNVYRSLKDAEKAQDAAERLMHQSIMSYEDLGVFKILFQDNLKPELQEFYDETIKPLVDYDRRRDTELVKTLSIYFNTNGNLKKMSEELFTHYNTVLYRINRIQEITEMNLDSERDRYALHTALKIIQIL